MPMPHPRHLSPPATVRVCCNSCIFFLWLIRVTKKSSSCVMFFCGKSCKPVTCITTKKLHGLTIFLYTRLPQKKIHDLTIFLYTRYHKKKIHDVTIFLLYAFTAKKKNYTIYGKKKLHDVTIFSYMRLPQKSKITQPYRKETITNFTENACL